MAPSIAARTLLRRIADRPGTLRYGPLSHRQRRCSAVWLIPAALILPFLSLWPHLPLAQRQFAFLSAASALAVAVLLAPRRPAQAAVAVGGARALCDLQKARSAFLCSGSRVPLPRSRTLLLSCSSPRRRGMGVSAQLRRAPRTALERALCAMLRSADSEGQLAALLTMLGLVLGAVEVCLVEPGSAGLSVLAAYAARSRHTSVTALLGGAPQECWHEILPGQRVLSVPVSCPDGATRRLLVVLGPGRHVLPSSEALIRAVAARCGQVLAGHCEDRRRSPASDAPEGEGGAACMWPRLYDLRRALRQLHYWVDLGRSPLAVLVPEGTPWQRGEALHNLLLATIEEMRPPEPDPDNPAWRQFVILQQHYVEARSRPSLLPDLGLSERQYQRELRRGIDALRVRLSALWEQRLAESRGAGP